MQTNQICRVAPTSLPHPTFHASLFRFSLAMLAVIALAGPSMATAQEQDLAAVPDPAPLVTVSVPDAAPSDFAGSTSPDSEATSRQSSSDAPSAAVTDKDNADPKPKKQTPESEIAVEGMYSYGNWQIFAAGYHEELYTAGIEYDRHTWGKFIGAQMDYAADFTPLVLLREPRVLNAYGIDRSRPGDNVILHGLAFSPIGLRMEWRHDKAFKPYFTVLGGAIGFTKKALSPDASYYDFTLHESIGFYLRMTQRVDMRFGLFGDFHFSNAYITSYNPGLDVMNSQLAVSYHLGG